MKTLKTALSLLLTLCLLLSFGTTAFAEVIPDNSDSVSEVTQDQSMVNNNGYVAFNYGEITNNNNFICHKIILE